MMLASTGCAVGSEDHELPTPQPAHEFSASLNGPDQAIDKQPFDLSTMWNDVGNTPEGPGYLRHPEVQPKPIVNHPPVQDQN
ncbi:MAG TPA: hypothetical protein VIF62_11740 [Labilithrix sp.]